MAHWLTDAVPTTTIETAQLVITELLTNALVHGGGVAEPTIEIRAGAVHIAVGDRAGGSSSVGAPLSDVDRRQGAVDRRSGQRALGDRADTRRQDRLVRGLDRVPLTSGESHERVIHHPTSAGREDALSMTASDATWEVGDNPSISPDAPTVPTTPQRSDRRALIHERRWRRGFFAALSIFLLVGLLGVFGDADQLVHLLRRLAHPARLLPVRHPPRAGDRVPDRRRAD